MLSTIIDAVDGVLGVGPEIYEDLEHSVEPGKQPFDHTVKPFYACHIAIVVVTPES